MKTKKIKAILLIAVIVASTVAMAQPGTPPPPPKPGKEKKKERREERKEDIEAMKIGFITKKVDLTPEEAQMFWPVYNEYSSKLQETRKKRRQDTKEAKQNFDEMADKDVETAIDNEMLMRQKELDLQKEYNSKFKKILPIKKVAKLYKAEEDFKMVLLNKLKGKPEPPTPPQPPPPPPKIQE